MHRVVGGTRTRDDSIHLTLAFVGDVDGEQLTGMLATPAGLTVTSFTLMLDCLYLHHQAQTNEEV